MSELLQQFHFLHPWWLLALLGLPLLALPCWRRDSGQLILSRLVDPALLPRLLRGQPRQRQLPLWLFALAADPSWWWTVVGPLAMVVLFVTVSIPMMDERSLARRPGYAEHMRAVPALIPRWTRRRSRARRSSA